MEQFELGGNIPLMNKFSRVAVVGAGAGGLCTAQCWKIRNIFGGSS
jgi:threonine dehydrogenase-like Zn-dependent dehydrogenase